MDKNIKFGNGEISAPTFSLALSDFLEQISKNKDLISGVSEDDAKKALTDLYNSVNGIKKDGKSGISSTKIDTVDNGSIGINNSRGTTEDSK